MKQRTGMRRETSEKVVRDIRRKTRRQFGAEEKIRIVLEGSRGDPKLGTPTIAAFLREYSSA